MSQAARPDEPEADSAERDLARVQHKVAAARAVLVRLLQEVVVAEARLSNSQAAQMLEANEQLVVTALRNRAEAELAAQALTKVSRAAELDPLTQLPNRFLLLDRFQQAMAVARRHAGRLALLFVDLDGFKAINDTLGHAAGDEVLTFVAHRLALSVRDADTVSRHGGDEFLILLTELAQPADAAVIAGKLLAALSAPTRVGAHVVRLTASIGISLFPDDGDALATLVARADAAMYLAKRRGPGCYAFHAVGHADPGPLQPETAPDPVVARHALLLDERYRMQAELREANEQLVLAALDAQQLREAAERTRRRQVEFLGLVAQELDNPLGPVRLAASMLGGAADQALVPKAKSIIEGQVELMARLVASVRAVASAEAAALGVASRPVGLLQVLDAAVSSCRPAVDTRLQSLELEWPEVSPQVRGEAERLQQVFRNLLDNASKYTPDFGQIRLGVVVAGGQVEVSVSDSGIGISAEALPRIFEPFVQDPYGVGYNGIGIGIGLTVVRTLVEAYGGQVRAHSGGIGNGSRFEVTLPLDPDAGAAGAQPPARADRN